MLDWPKFESCRRITAQTIKFVSKKMESIVGNGENAGDQHFLLFSQSFQTALPSWVGKTQACVVKSC